MSSISPKLRLVVPSRADAFSTQDLINNWNALDAAPGSYVCTSTTRPSWNSAQAGRKIMETDTLLEWMWDGTKFVRLYGVGLLKSSNGAWAIGERTTDFSTNATDYVKVISVTSVKIPPGNRPIRVDITGMNIFNSKGKGMGVAIFRSNTNNSGPLQGHWNIFAGGDGSIGSGAAFYSIERNGLAPGTYDFSFQTKSLTDGTAWVKADANQPTSIQVSEM